MQHIITTTYKTPVGELLLGVFDDQLCLCDWRYRKMRSTIDKRLCTLVKAEMVPGEHPVHTQTIQQLDEYFTQQRKNFDVPLLLVGTEFQQLVWRQLQTVVFGETSSYQQLSEKIGNARAVRAVANANGANAISIIIPCHRIIGSNGELTGYAGGLPAKEKLLQLEQDLLAA